MRKQHSHEVAETLQFLIDEITIYPDRGSILINVVGNNEAIIDLA